MSRPDFISPVMMSAELAATPSQTLPGYAFLNPNKSPMLVDQLRISVANFLQNPNPGVSPPNLPGFFNLMANSKIDIMMGGIPLTNGLVPITSLFPMYLCDQFFGLATVGAYSTWDDQSGTVFQFAPFDYSTTLHLEKPLYVPYGTTFQIRIQRASNADFPAFVFSMHGRSLPNSFKRPEKIWVPWAAGFQPPFGDGFRIRTSAKTTRCPTLFRRRSTFGICRATEQRLTSLPISRCKSPRAATSCSFETRRLSECCSLTIASFSRFRQSSTRTNSFELSSRMTAASTKPPSAWSAFENFPPPSHQGSRRRTPCLRFPFQHSTPPRWASRLATSRPTPSFGLASKASRWSGNVNAPAAQSSNLFSPQSYLTARCFNRRSLAGAQRADCRVDHQRRKRRRVFRWGFTRAARLPSRFNSRRAASRAKARRTS